MNSLKDLIKKTPLSYIFIFLKSLFVAPSTQNDEQHIIDKINSTYDIPNTFIEFGFSGWEFNCAYLAKTWTGLLLDGDPYNIKIAKILWGSNITLENTWLTLDNIKLFKDWLGDRDLGILSIDVDGNDYWFLKELISLKPALVIAEYNSQLGLQSISVPYDPEFDRNLKHESRAYFGASLSAISNLAQVNGYSLIDITKTGVNAFFIRNDLLKDHDEVLDHITSFRKKTFPDGSRFPDQWDLIKDMEYVEISSI